MTTPSKSATTRNARAKHDDIRQICGNLDDDKVNAVLALSPSLEDLVEAVAWITGTGDLLSRAGHPLAGIVADVVAIIQADERAKLGLRR